MSRLGIQIALYHSSGDLPVVLESLRAQTFSDWELFLYENSCDAAETEREQKILDASGIPYQLVVGQENLGFSAHNVLFQYHQSEFVLVLNDDAYLDHECLEKMVARMDAEASCAAVTGLVYKWTMSGSDRQPLHADTVIDSAGIDYRCLSYAIERCEGKTVGSCSEPLHEAHRVFGISGAAAMYRRRALLEVSPEGFIYDPSFFMYKEDVELAIRLHRKGYTCWFEPKAHVFHRRSIGNTTQTAFARLRAERKRPAFIRLMTYRNQWMIYIYHGSWNVGLKDIAMTIVKEFGRSVLVFLASPILFFKAWAKILHDARPAFRRRKVLRDLGMKPFSWV